MSNYENYQSQNIKWAFLIFSKKWKHGAEIRDSQIEQNQMECLEVKCWKIKIKISIDGLNKSIDMAKKKKKSNWWNGREIWRNITQRDENTINIF